MNSPCLSIIRIFPCFFLALMTLSSFVQSQTYPDKPIRLIVPYAPGGGADYLARPLGQKLTESLGQPVLIDNRGGANGAIGAEAVMRAAPDGYTLLYGAAGGMTIGPAFTPNLKYNTTRDFVPVALIVNTPASLIVHPSVGAKSLKELIAYARANPGKLKYGSAGVGSTAHLAGELFDEMAKVKTEHVPYKGAGPMVTDLISGRIEMTFIGIFVVQQHVIAGKLSVLAVAGNKRSPIAPDVPTMTEAGLPGYLSSSWYGVFAPTGTSSSIVSKLNSEINRTLTHADIKGLLAKTGADVEPGPPEQFAEFIRNEQQIWAKLAKSVKIEQ